MMLTCTWFCVLFIMFLSADGRMSFRHKQLGGVNVVDSTDPEVQEAARFALESIREQNPSLGSSINMNIVKAGKQVVSGIMYFLELELQSAGGQFMRVEVEVWSQPWMKPPMKLHKLTYLS